MADVCTCGDLKVIKAGTRVVDGVERCNLCNRPRQHVAVREVVPIEPHMISTRDELPGFAVVRTLGVVSELSTAGGLWGYGAKSATALEEVTRTVRQSAAQLGANAILGLHGSPFSIGRTGVATSDAVGVLLMGDAVEVTPI